ncbi:SNF related kinase isoform X2 [Andrena cerasifolii]|uniref:SNF related kinase isoform X2 n=1 Tax=Andrena cerasifolii TaxID=2819439 RepID=UPI0040376FAF
MHRRVGYSNYDGKIAGLYDLEETLGRGHFAVVKLARHVFTGEKVAVKVIDKSKLDEVSRAHLFQEVRCMKLVQHPNVVRLYEVIDTQTKLYLILELGDGGDLYDYIMRHDSGLSEEVARTYFRQIVRAISYCHRLHVVHRDLKPENVVFFEKLGTVKLTDFGFSNRFCPGQKLETSCGSLAYSAPEILLGDSYDAPAVVCGQAPFQEANDSETLTMIMDCKYSIPPHVSEGCKRLIAKMLVREPEGRARLEEIAADSWLAIGSDSDFVETLPLVSRQQVSDDHHNHIITKMVNGNIATKEEILDALDKNEYNHITATYFLLAERKLRAHRQEQVQKTRPEILEVSPSRQGDAAANLRADQNSLTTVNQSLLSVPRTPGDVPQSVRTRKCSIVQEEEDEDDVSSCSGRDDRGSNSALNSFNRRGSRSEGKLSHILQERLPQLPEKPILKPLSTQRSSQKDGNVVQIIGDGDERLKSDSLSVIGNEPQASNPLAEQVPAATNLDVTCQENLKNRLGDASSPGWARKVTAMENRPKSVTECLNLVGPVPANKWMMGAHRSPATSLDSCLSSATLEPYVASTTTTTTILTESSTVSIPLHPVGVLSDNELSMTPKYKTMPSPGSAGSASSPQLTLNEILEDGDTVPVSTTEGGNSKYRVVRRAGYQQRRSKFHKARTTSCSSSDASDDDSESRKKRAHKLGASTGKPLPPRRDSHDDSSDSQDPGGSGGGGGGVGNGEHTTETPSNETNRNDSGNSTGTTTTTTTTTTSGRHRSTENQVIFGRRHRAGRRRAGETRLRESQSLNRITEVQEAEAPSSCHNHVSRNSAVLGVQSISSSSSSSVSQGSTGSHSSVPQPTSQTSATVQKAKGFGARLLQSWSLSSAKLSQSSNRQNNCSTNGRYNKQEAQRDTCQRIEICRDDRDLNGSAINQMPSNDKENRNTGMNRNDCKNRKIRLLSRYFAVHKKLCVPLPGIFGKGRLYKARSCGSITRDRVSPPSPKSMLFCSAADDKWRERRQWCDAKHRGSDGDINQNLGLPHLVQDNVVGKGCTALPTVCHIHLGDASKCCSLC